MKHRLLKQISTPLVMISCAFILCTCRYTEEEGTSWYLDSLQLWVDYEAAVQDARLATAEEICHTLPAITTPEDNPQIEWTTGTDSKLLVRVVSLASATMTAQWTVGQSFEAGEAELIWVTLPYDLEAHVRAFDPCRDSLECAMRMIQLLGLPPNCGYDQMAFFSVAPTGLLRPTPDPEIDDHETSLQFSANAPEHYRTWFTQNATASYTSDNRYPWTRLGYTYNWNANATSHIGPGEFIIHPGTMVHPERLTTLWTWYKEITTTKSI